MAQHDLLLSGCRIIDKSPIVMIASLFVATATAVATTTAAAATAAAAIVTAITTFSI
jgi:hypothetical protein